MRIAYFTTCQSDEIFSKSILKNQNINSSNQVFHSRIINSLSLNNDIHVFSFNQNKEKCDSYLIKESTITWQYLSTRKNMILNVLKQVKECIHSEVQCEITIVDTMNIRCLLAARKYANKNNVKLIGLLTDNPFNISGLSSNRAKQYIKYARKCDAYIYLNEGLNKLFNADKKPSLLIKGITDNNHENNKVDSPYFFYAGTLLKQYGVIDLINAFESLNLNNVKLIIAGHHVNQEFLDSIKNKPNILYLGNIENKEVIKYENGSIANINPRPFIENIDSFSIPSKVIEYSSKNSLLISGISTSLKEDFKDSILWVDDIHSLSNRMSEAYSMNIMERNNFINDMNRVSKENFSKEITNSKINNFIAKLGDKYE